MATQFGTDDLKVGQRFQSSEYLVDAKEIVEFATQYDPQHFHLDANAAAKSFFGGLSASGWHTAAITMRLIVNGGALPVAGGIIGVDVKLEWRHPVRPGDRLRVESEILEIKPSRSMVDRAKLTVEFKTKTHEDAVVQSMTAIVMASRQA